MGWLRFAISVGLASGPRTGRENGTLAAPTGWKPARLVARRVLDDPEPTPELGGASIRSG